MSRFKGWSGLGVTLIAAGLLVAGYGLVQRFWPDNPPPKPATAPVSAASPEAAKPEGPTATVSDEAAKPVVNHPPADLSGAEAPSPVAPQESAAIQQPLEPRISGSDAARKTLPAKPTTAPDLLQACWSQDQLRASTTDRKLGKPAEASPTAASPTPASPLPSGLSRSIRYVKPRDGEKLVALTFDLCEQANEIGGYDASLVNYLRDQQVKATFFAGGKWMRSHPDRTMQLMADPLFEIGNHAWTHANLRVADGPKMIEQIARTQREYGTLRERLLKSACASAFAGQLAASVPPQPRLFRFPYGACDGPSLAEVNGEGLAAIQWNIVTGDPAKGQSARGIARVVLDQIRPGSIIVAHANGRGWHTAEALPLIVPALRARGYRFVTVSELLARGEVVAADSCYELKPGDNLRYDRPLHASLKR